MPTISHDARSLIIDGRRIWLVSGSIHYARIPRDLWAKRIAVAKRAGLNCISTNVFWNLHEPEPGAFVFDGEADLRHFLKLIAEAGMYCILRAGPYVGGGWDFGGLPAWLTTHPNVMLRQANREAQGFLEACARYLGAVMEQVRDLQLTSPVPVKGGSDLLDRGPIVLVQVEHEWFCHHDAQALTYLNELVRYLRENGCTVPVITANNFWQPLDGVFDTWHANEHLATDLRQVQQVQPEAPRIVSEFWCGQADTWGAKHERESASLCEYRLAQILSTGSQYNIHMFHGGTNFGFYGGRCTTAADAYLTTSFDYDAPVTEGGSPSEKYWAIKRISTFASQFGHIFAHLDPDTYHVAVEPNEQQHPPSIIHQHGAQGDVVFVIKSETDCTTDLCLMLAEGLSLPVPLGSNRVTWLLLHANLDGVAELTYTNLCPWAFISKRMLVLFGPSGAKGLVAIDDALMRLTVPDGRKPLIEKHAGLTVVVLNNEQIDAANITPDGLLIGTAGVDEDGQPIHLEGWSSLTLVQLDGQTVAKRITRPKIPTAPKLSRWKQAAPMELIDGSANQYKPIPGPTSLEALDCPYGYGWYRIGFNAKRAACVMTAGWGDRLHLFRDGKLQTILGRGPSTHQGPVNLELCGQYIVLADNLGRIDDGWLLGEKKGLYGHLYEVKPVTLTNPSIDNSSEIDPFELGGYFRGLHYGERTLAKTFSWSVKSIGSQPLILEITGLSVRAMVQANGSAVGLYDPQQTPGSVRYVMEFGQHLRRRPNQLCLSVFDRSTTLSQIADSLHVYQCTGKLTPKAQWAFAPWKAPQPSAYRPLSTDTCGLPSWFRCTFNVENLHVPLWFEANKISKGQIYLNGYNVGRYFVATPEGEPIGPQLRYYLPEPWLRVGQLNELILFDEHGQSPSCCRLAYDLKGPYG